MNLKKILYILFSFIFVSTAFAAGQRSITGPVEDSSGFRHQREELTISRLTPANSHHKNTIILSNGIKYKIYPFHGWDLEHWKTGQLVRLEKSQDLLYKVKILNLSTDDSISAKRRAAM